MHDMTRIGAWAGAWAGDDHVGRWTLEGGGERDEMDDGLAERQRNWTKKMFRLSK